MGAGNAKPMLQRKRRKTQQHKQLKKTKAPNHHFFKLLLVSPPGAPGCTQDEERGINFDIILYTHVHALVCD